MDTDENEHWILAAITFATVGVTFIAMPPLFYYYVAWMKYWGF